MKKAFGPLAACGLAIALAHAIWSDAADPAGPVPVQPDLGKGNEIIFLADARPLLIKLYIQVDGKPLSGVWDKFAQDLFHSLDKNSDGILDAVEVRQLPPVQAVFANENVGAGTSQVPPGTNGKVTIEDLKKHFQRNGGSSFQARFRSTNSQRTRAYSVVSGELVPVAPEALHEALFKLLDTNKDGKLSRDDLAQASAIVVQKDDDDDEMITPAELLSITSDPADEIRFARMAEAKPAEEPFVVLTPEESPRNLARRLLARYGSQAPAGKKAASITKSAKGSLTRGQLGLDEAAFVLLDADGDGNLDTEELAQFARRPADIELVVRLDTPPARTSLKIITRPDAPSALAANLKFVFADFQATLQLGNTRLEFRTEQTSAMDNKASAVNRRQSYIARFKNLDQDNNDYIDRTESQRDNFFNSLFTNLDQDGDGKIFEKEMFAYLDKVEAVQAKARSSIAALEITDQGQGLFDRLDTNGDGRLSVREMRKAVNLLASLDADGDGQIGRTEIPRNYLLGLRQGAVNMNLQQGQRVPPAYTVEQKSTSALTPGPLWFRKMDRNRDSDVSRREFLGPAEDFAHIDTDGDGLISADEANRADKALRK